MTDKEQREIFSKNLSYRVYISDKSQKEIAIDLKISPTTFNNWCKGVSMPTAGKIQRLADYFHITKSALLDAQYEEEFVISDFEKLLIEKYRASNMQEAIKKLLEL